VSWWVFLHRYDDAKAQEVKRKWAEEKETVKAIAEHLSVCIVWSPALAALKVNPITLFVCFVCLFVCLKFEQG
jgi:hypothetical protein